MKLGEKVSLCFHRPTLPWYYFHYGCMREAKGRETPILELFMFFVNIASNIKFRCIASLPKY